MPVGLMSAGEKVCWFLPAPANVKYRDFKTASSIVGNDPMRRNRRTAVGSCASVLFLLVGIAVGEKPAKNYPEEGKVVGTGMAERGQEVKSHL